MYIYNDNEAKWKYKGTEIHCPQCGRIHGLGVEQSCLSSDNEPCEMWMQCPTCGLKFEGVSVANWRRSEKFKELDKALKDLSNAFTKQASATEDKIVWTVYRLDENLHDVVKCFRTKCKVSGVEYILNQLNNTCRKGEKYVAWEELD